MTKYVRNEEGTIHSVTDEHFENVLHETSNSGRRYMLPGWEEVSEAAAKKANPQLFGAPDPQITYTDEELARALTRKKQLAELHAEEAAAEAQAAEDLKGAELDKALEDAGLPKTGSADEKRARLAEHQANNA